MAKFISGRQSQLNIGVLSSTENNTSLQVTGKVGIGTTNADGRSLYVLGDAEVSGVTTATRFSTGPIGEAVNITSTGITGPETIIIDPAGVGVNTGAVRIKGDLYVDGTQTIIDSTTVELKDFQIGIASDISTNILLDGAGIGIGSTNIRKTLTYDYTSDSLKSSEHFDLAANKTYKIDELEILRKDRIKIEYSDIGIGTFISVTGADLAFGTGDIDNLFTNIGLVTALSGTNLDYTYAGIGSLSGNDLYYINGNFGTADIDVGYISSGIVTNISGDTLSYNSVKVISDLLVSGVTTVSGTTDFYQDINVGGATSITGNLFVGGTSEFIGVVTFRGGTINIGDSDTDDVVIGGEFASDLVPTSSDTYDLGEDSKQWRDLYISNIAHVERAEVVVGVLTAISGTDLTYTIAGIDIGHIAIGIITTLSGTDVFYTNGNFDTADIDTAYITSGITTTLQSTDSLIDNLYAVSGIVTAISGTDLTYTIAGIDTGHIAAGIITTLQSYDSVIQNLYGVTGIVTTLAGTDLTYTTADIDNLYATTGIVTYLSGTNSDYTNISANDARIVTGLVTAISGTDLTYTIAGIDTGHIASGIVTTLQSTDSLIENLYAVSGIVTTLAGTDLTYTTADIDTAYVTSGIVTTLQSTTGIIQQLYNTVGIITTLGGTNITYSGAASFNHVGATQINATGVVTASQFYSGSIVGPSEIIIDPAVVGDDTGVVRVKGDFYADGDTFIVNSTQVAFGDANISIAGTITSDAILEGAGVGFGATSILKSITYKNSTDSFRPNINLDLDSGKTLLINGSEVLSASQLTVPSISASGGISTLGNTVIGGGTTELVVGGDARITGILTIGTSSITLDGTTNQINVGTGLTLTSDRIDIVGVVSATTFSGSFEGELPSPGNTYFVASTGDDTNTGTNSSSPFASLVQALSVATSGDTIFIGSGTFTEVFPLTVPVGVTIKGQGGLRGTFIQPTSGTKQNDAFLMNGETTIEDITIGNFFEPGVGFKFASGCKTTSRSPYVQRVTVLNKGSATSATDPYGFDTPHTPPTYYRAGRGVLVDGSVCASDTLEAAMLFNECTFICPNNTAMEMTNGARAEWVNCFTYFADKGIYAHDGTTGLGGVGYTRIKTGTITGSTPTTNDNVYYLESNYQTGTYSQSGTTLTITKVGHGLTVGDRIYADFTSGSASDGYFLVSNYVDADNYSVTAPSATTSGNLTYKEALGFGTIRSYDASAGISSFIGKGEGLFQLPTERPGKTVTAFGGAALTTAVKKFGTASLLLDGTGDYARVTSNADFGFNTGDLTIETFIRPVSIGSSQNIIDLRDSVADDPSLHVTLTSGNVVSVSYGTTSIITGSTSISTGQWYHVAVSRSSGSTKLFVNGSQDGSTYSDSNNYGVSKPLVVGADYSGSNEFNGYIDEVRISNNTRYSTTFTPTTVPFISDGNDKILLHFDGLTGSTSFSDSSTPTQDVRWVRAGSDIATASSITLADYQKFGGDMRSIGSASVFGNTGAVAEGPGCTLRLFAFNFSHIGSGKDFTQDISLINQSSEVLTSDNGKIYYASIDQSGDFRVGGAFYVNQENGTVNFGGQDFTLNSLSDLNITDGTNTTIITPTTITVGNVQLTGNELITTSGDLVLNPSGISSTRVEGDLRVTGSLDLGYSLLGGLDGDKGDITVSASFTQWTIDTSAVTLAKIQDIGTGKVLGRTTAGSGVVEELSTTGTGSVVLSNAPTLASITITGDLAVDTNVLKVDSGTNRVGVNKTSPGYALDVVGDINSSTAVKVNGVSILDQASGDATALAIALG